MNNALIGFTGFVGTTLQKQASFQHLYNSKNISEIRGKHFDIVVCAGAPAQKWVANKQPQDDLALIEGLISNLAVVTCDYFIHISTVDVFSNPQGVDESTVVIEDNLQPYGLHRRYLEKFVEQHFENHLIVRLPGLVGPGLRKNVVYDFLHQNNLDAIDSRNVFQFYPMVNLWYDIQNAINNKLSLIHLTAEPISVQDVSEKGFGLSFNHTKEGCPVRYDMRSKYASLYSSESFYQYSQRDSIQAVRSYAQSESIG